MHDLDCRTARVFLQAPDDLAVLDGRRLQRHLSACSACETYRREQSALDTVIRRTLIAATDGVSVRAQVRARLAAPAVRQRPRVRLPLKPLWAAVPIAVAAVLVAALVVPRLSGSHQTAPPVSATPFKAKRIDIGYPVAVDATRPGHLLVGADGEVYESWNAGTTFHQLAPLPRGLVVRDLAIDSSDPHRYVVASRNSVLVSDDAGAHWRLTAQGLLGAENIFLTQDPRNPATFYVGPSILWKSSDHARSWQPSGRDAIFGSGGASGIQAIAVAPNGDLYTAIWNGGVALSHDGGATWQPRSHGLPRKVLDVAVGPGGTLWAAATDAGVYRSLDGGLHWRHVGPPMHLFTTGVLDRGTYVLAGGNGGIFRSTDGGRHWIIVDDGLPLAAYVFGFVADPRNSQRVYVSLDDDGVFRSDDGGLHWQSAQGNIPATIAGSSPLIVFRRAGQVWRTDPAGADPGNLTADTHAVAASVSPDGAAVAYTTGESGRWWLRVVASGGSQARTLISGNGSTPRQILWSPDATRAGVVAGTQVETARVSPIRRFIWSLPPGGSVLGARAGIPGVLVWDPTGRVQARAWTTGAPRSPFPGVYRSPPALAPDGRQVAMVSGGRLLVGPWGALRPVAAVAPDCRVTHWSDDASRLLLGCARGVQIRTASGRLLAAIPTVARAAFWVPGSNTDLLFFRGGLLWRWSPAQGAFIIVRDAHGLRGASFP